MASTDAALTDDQRRAHFSELGRRGVESRRARKAAVERIVRATRQAQGLPPTVEDNTVLDMVASHIERQIAARTKAA